MHCIIIIWPYKSYTFYIFGGHSIQSVCLSIWFACFVVFFHSKIPFDRLKGIINVIVIFDVKPILTNHSIYPNWLSAIAFILIWMSSRFKMKGKKYIFLDTHRSRHTFTEGAEQSNVTYAASVCMREIRANWQWHFHFSFNHHFRTFIFLTCAKKSPRIVKLGSKAKFHIKNLIQYIWTEWIYVSIPFSFCFSNQHPKANLENNKLPQHIHHTTSTQLENQNGSRNKNIVRNSLNNIDIEHHFNPRKYKWVEIVYLTKPTNTHTHKIPAYQIG